jgi:hypothetical protein
VYIIHPKRPLALTFTTCLLVAGRLSKYRISVHIAYGHVLNSTWPAVWENGDPWPYKVRLQLACIIISLLLFATIVGVSRLLFDLARLIYKSNREVDIVEGVNSQGTNQVTLHTSGGMCTGILDNSGSVLIVVP